jgi:acetyl-CoA decarbonylase/synthase complex subunit gamma
MALTGLEIFKQLPKTNCKECGFPTCLAFAMKLSQKGTDLAKCPYVSDETRAALDAAAAPPIRLVKVGVGERAFEIGNETVLFRHEKTFVHDPGLVIHVKDTAADIATLAAEVSAYTIERVGIGLYLNGIALENSSGDAATFAAAAETVKVAAPGLPIVLMADETAAFEAALAVVGAERPLICAATAASVDALAALAVKHACPLVVRGEDGDLNGLLELTDRAKAAGAEDIILDPGARGLAAELVAMTQLHRLALKKNMRELGYPMISFAGAETLEAETIHASQAILKYAGVVVLDHFEPAELYVLMTLRQNIYTDPQKPIQVESALYEVGKVTADSPLLVTTNFSLTYFVVQGEIESAGVPSWLLVTDADGLSVLTAWAAGKFDAERIAKTIKTLGVAEKLNHQKLVIPGYVAGLSGELEEELPGWEIMVGPREAADVSKFLKDVWVA